MSLSTSDQLLPDFRRLFNSAPARYIVVDRQWRIVAVTDSAIAGTGLKREDILGKVVTDVFRDNPDDPTANGSQVLRDALERVVNERAGHTLPVQRYDIEINGVFEERYWQPLNEPVFDDSGAVEFIIHGVEDVTASMKSGTVRG
ncbi:PAS domain S-box protein [Mycolicibacterium goodii]|uniref:PAS domain S-box protein n=1 Tax=Mycolicibacterium goodii TaxID=134601 RepID=UPI001BDD8A28|nr:PAS domain-containing protein [Mycolicibacterium goodii]MBU8816796.1 PAS domain-containing protein [Mycolicibacterium goodii]MBU8828279.1 PAS domain-containing protein [Mycolicibacterium goodii]